MKQKLEKLITLLIVLSVTISLTSANNEILFTESFEFNSSGYESRIITYPENFAENFTEEDDYGFKIIPFDPVGENLHLSILLNESAEVLADWRNYDLTVVTISNIENLNHGNITHSFPFAFVEKINNSYVAINPETDDPYKFKIVVYHETEGNAQISLKFGISPQAIHGDQASSVSTDFEIISIPITISVLVIIIKLKIDSKRR